MTNQKLMTFGEGGTAFAMAALVVLSVAIAANSYTPEYTFHACLFAGASLAAVFAIVDRYYDRPAELPPLTIDGKPNYNMGPVKPTEYSDIEAAGPFRSISDGGAGRRLS